MSKYIYDGPVMVFDKCVANNWRGETIAESEGKARNNLAYQFKKRNNQIAKSRVTLPGKLLKVN